MESKLGTSDCTPSCRASKCTVLADRISNIENSLNRLIKTVQGLSGFSPVTRNFNPTGFSNNPTNANSGRLPQHSSVMNSNRYCYFHNKFGSAALKCKQPCCFSMGKSETKSADTAAKGFKPPNTKD